MAMIGLKVPHSISNHLAKVPCEGKKSEPEEMHITICHLGNDDGIEKLLKTIHICHEFCRYIKPFQVGTCLRTSFEDNGEGFPIIMRILSPVLHELRSDLCNVLDKLNIEYSKKYPIFEPHVTVSYSAVRLPDLQINPCIWSASHITVFGGNSKNNYVSTDVLFGHGFNP